MTNRAERLEPPSLGQVYPSLARWASAYGCIEFGTNGLGRTFVRALDEGETVWERESSETLDEALRAMETGLSEYLKQNFDQRPSSRKQPASRSNRRPRKSTSEAGTDLRQTLRKPRKARSEARTDQHLTPEEQKAIKKVEKLDEIAKELRRGGHFSVTRLTIIKGLCEGPEAARAFALFLACKIQRRMREKEAPQRYRELVTGPSGR